MPHRTDPDVLLVEDDRMDVRIFRRAADRAGLAVPISSVPDGRSALDHLRQRLSDGQSGTPVLIVLDLNMPVMDGFEFLSELRDDPALKDNVVFVLTTSNDPRDIRRAYGYNVAGYLTKCSTFDAVIEKMDVLHGYLRHVDMPRARANGAAAG